MTLRAVLSVLRSPWLLVVLIVGASVAALLGTTVDVSFRISAPATPRVSEAAGTMLRVTWHPVPRADYYRVAVRHGTSSVARLKVEGTDAQIAGLAPGTTYRVRVAAVEERAGKDPRVSDPSEPAVAHTTGRTSPALLVPASPTVIDTRNTSLTVGWEPVASATGYDVEVASGRDFEHPTTVRSDGRTAEFTDLDAGTAYFVRVRATGPDDRRSEWTGALKATTIQPTDPLPLAVATYNVKCHSCGGPSWRNRRGAVAATIASRGLDVVGLQEAQQSGGPQFADLLNTLNHIQPGWELTSRKVDGTLGVRIIYNTRRVRLLKEGGVRFHRQGNGSHYHQRFYTWGLFRQRSSGKEFLFFDTHLDPDSRSARIDQGRELAQVAEQLRGKLPAIVVGDLNASQFHDYDVHVALTSAGLRDPLGILRSSHAVGPDATAERRINTNYDSFNDFASRPKVSVGPTLNGTYIDYIFTTPMRVIEFENVVNLDSDGHYRGAASDHNMIRAVVGLQ